MPLKIIHHKEQNVEQEKKNISLNIEDNLIKMFFFCENVINTTNLILKKINFSKLIESIDDETKKNTEDKDLTNLEDVFFKKSEEFKKMMDLFSIIFGKKTSLLEAISKTTLIIQKINVLAKKFDISLKTEEKNNDYNILTDDDIDIMVQMVKDFGEEQIRKDAKECREKLLEKDNLENKKQASEVDVYDIYHNKLLSKTDKQLN